MQQKSPKFQGELHFADFAPVSYDEWRQAAEKTLQGGSFDKRLVTKTLDDIEVRPLYTRQDVPADDPAGFPGLPPYTRGAAPLGEVPEGWEICQEYAEPAADQAGRAVATDLSRGVGAIRLRLDRSLRRGLDPAEGSDEPDGILVAAREDLARALGDVDLGRIPVHLEAGAATLPVTAALLSLAREAGIAPDELTGTVGFDPIAVLAAEGTLPFDLDGAYRLVADLAAWGRRHAPALRTVVVSASPYHRAGASPAQEIAFAIGAGVETLRRLEAQSLELEHVAGAMLFEVDVGRDLFTEIAKLRAARLLWTRVLEASGLAEPPPMRIHAFTTPRTKTIRDPWVNMLRTTAEAFSAVLGGADSISTTPFDERIGVPDGFSRRIARNTQSILRQESNLHRATDPAGGSWFLESLTTELGRKAWTIFQEIDGEGGMARALVDGRIGRRIGSTAGRRGKAIATRKEPITGVSIYPNLEEAPVKKEPVPGETLRKWLRRGNGAAHRGALDGLGRADAGDGSLTDAVIEAIGSGTRFVDVVGTLGSGEPVRLDHRLEPTPDAAPFERFRDVADRYAEKTGQRPRCFLANMGPIPQHEARAGFSAGFFGAGGIEAVENDGFETPDQAARAFAESGARIAVICSTDDTYPDIVPDLAPKLRERGAELVFLAGRPGDREESYRNAGVDEFIFLGCNVEETLARVLHRLGVIE